MIARIAIFVMFQIGWFAFVLSAAAGRPWLGALPAAGLVLANAALSPVPRRTLVLVAVVGVIGPPADALLVHAGLLTLREPLLFGLLMPLWWTVLWLLFASTLHASFAWLFGRPVIAGALGALAGPASYWAGARLGAIGLHADVWPSLVAIAVEWMVYTPLLVWLAELTSARWDRVAAAREAPTNRGGTRR